MVKILPLYALMLAGLCAADTLELKTGERLDGTFRQAGVTGVVIETAGQAITIPLAKVRAIYLGVAPVAFVAATPAAPKPSQDVMDALTALRSVTSSGVSFQDFAPRVLDAKIKADRYLSTATNDPQELRASIARAVREFELASKAFDGTFRGHGDLSAWEAIEKNPGSDVLASCPVITAVAKRVQLAAAYDGLGGRDVAIINGQSAHIVLWTCANAEVGKAERYASGGIVASSGSGEVAIEGHIGPESFTSAQIGDDTPKAARPVTATIPAMKGTISNQ